MKIYTKTGDRGETGLFGGGRVRKDHARIGAYGTLDEVNATLGVVRAEVARADRLDDAAKERFDAILREAQNRLFDLGAELATPDAAEMGLEVLGEADVARLEAAIDDHENQLEPLKQFILPGGTALAAQLHLARCVCRRAERRMVTLGAEASIRELPLRYVNRLSDLLFVLARSANRASGIGDTPWTKAEDIAPPVG